jgi:WD40 repeat protein
MLATGGTDAVVCLVETDELICLHTLAGIDNVVSLLSFSSDSQWLAFSEEGATDVLIASVATGERLIPRCP